MEIHEYADMIPRMLAEEYESLKQDIKQNGLIEPIVLYDGKILDGRHRYNACKELGIKPNYINYDGEDALSFVIAKNIHRRSLTKSQLATLAVELLPRIEEEAKKRMLSGKADPGKLFAQGRKKGRSREIAADITGVNQRYITDAKKIRNTDNNLFNEMKKGEVTISEAKKIIKKDIAKEKKEKKAIEDNISTKEFIASDSKYTLHCLPVNKLSSVIKPNSVDFIITDPPYPKEYLYTYKELAELAEIVLKPGGSLIAMAGQTYLPEVMKSMGEHLVYHWMVAYLTPGASLQIFAKNILCGWKPLLWYTKGAYHGEWCHDVTKSNKQDKEHHEWGQSESGFEDIIKKYTRPGDIILDPFLGGGTTGVIAVELNRFFIGADIEQDCINKTQERLEVLK